MASFLFFLMMVAHVVFIFLSVTASSDHDLDKFSHISEDSATTATKPMRELMGGSNAQWTINKDNMKLDDYSPIDPVPSASSAVTSGPTEHGTPLLPYIPRLPPPYVDFPLCPPPPA